MLTISGASPRSGRVGSWGAVYVDRRIDRCLGPDEVTAECNPDWPHGWLPTHETVLYFTLTKGSVCQVK